MTQPAQEPNKKILTLSEIRYLGGLVEEREFPQGDPHIGWLTIIIDYNSYQMIKCGELDFIIRKPCRQFSKQLLGRNYKIVKLINIVDKKRGKNRNLFCEYEGYFEAKSNHLVTMNGSDRKEVNQGDFIIKIGRPLKELV